MDNYQTTEIRRLLQLYYEGKTSREEERILTSLLREAKDLPADLEAERELFTLLAETPEVTIPQRDDNAITDALEREMKADANASGRHTSKIWRQLLSAAAVAACLILAWTILRNYTTNEHENRELKLLVDIPEDKQLISDTSVTIINLSKAEAKAHDHGTGVKSDSSVTKKIEVKPGRPDDEAARKYPDGYLYLSEEEEDLLEANNYRVVSDEQEAYAIINSVFSRLDGNIIESDYRINDINDEYARIINVSM